MSVSVRVAAACGLAVALAFPAANASAKPASSGLGHPTSTVAAGHQLVTSEATPVPRVALLRLERARAGATRAALGLPGAERLIVKDVIRDADGASHIRYDRTYRGLPVVGGDLIVHRSPAGPIGSVTWGSRADLSSLGTTRPDIPGSAAVRRAQVATGLESPAATPSLVVWALGATPRLAWKTVVSGVRAGGPARDAAIVDATSGAGLAHWSELETADAIGKGRTRYSGTVRIHTQKVGPHTFRMRDLKRGGHFVVDMNNTARQGGVYTDKDNVWGNGKGSSEQTAAADAQYGAAVTWDFYKNTFGRHGIADNGKAAYSRVHYKKNFDNAFWDDSCFCMTYGDGGDFKPVLSLDVAGHEMSHGVTSHTAGLLYFGESGGINEATSDIFGTGVEFSAHNKVDKADYYIGENIVPFAPHFLRRMDNPKADAKLYGGQVHSYNCYEPLMGRDDVHFTSGVANHFFYLLAEGTGKRTIGGRPHASTTCNGSSISGIGRTKALKIWYRALTVYMTSGTDYQDARDATIRAASDLYGSASAACATVANTWTGLKVDPLAWTCAGPIATGTGNLVTDGGFEGGNAHWLADTGVIVKAPALARSGGWYAYLNGYGSANTNVVQQDVSLASVPSGTTITLAYYLFVDSSDPRAGVDTFKVQVDSGSGFVTLATIGNTGWDDTYHRQTVDLSNYAGTDIALRFLGTENATNQTSFLLDDVSITQG